MRALNVALCVLLGLLALTATVSAAEAHDSDMRRPLQPLRFRFRDDPVPAAVFGGVDTIYYAPSAPPPAQPYAGTSSARWIELNSIFTSAVQAAPKADAYVFLGPEFYFSNSQLTNKVWQPFGAADAAYIRGKAKAASQANPTWIFSPGTIHFAIDMPAGAAGSIKNKLVLNCAGVYYAGREVMFHCKRGNAGDVNYDQANNKDGMNDFGHYFDIVTQAKIGSWLPAFVNTLRAPATSAKIIAGATKQYPDMDLDPAVIKNFATITTPGGKVLEIGIDICVDHGTAALQAATIAKKKLDILLIPSYGQTYNANACAACLTDTGYAISSDSSVNKLTTVAQRKTAGTSTRSLGIYSQALAKAGKNGFVSTMTLDGTVVVGVNANAYWISTALPL